MMDMNLDGGGSEGELDFLPMMQGMMQNLLSKEVLYPALKDLKDKVRQQCGKKVVSDSPGLVDFAIKLMFFVHNLPDGQVLFLGEIQITEGLLSILLINRVLWLVEMTCGLVHAIYSLPEWQAVKLTFFAPWAKKGHPGHPGQYYTSVIWRDYGSRLHQVLCAFKHAT